MSKKVVEKVTEDQKMDYVNHGGCNCPRCGSTNIEGEGFEVDSGGAWQEMGCNDCELQWHDEYKLTSISNVS